MTETQKKQLKAKIVAELERGRQDSNSLKELTKPVGFEDMDEITRMDAIVNKSVNDAALAALKTRLAGLEYALKRLDDPDFGYCMECGEEIPLARLFAMPEANKCVNCAE